MLNRQRNTVFYFFFNMRKTFFFIVNDTVSVSACFDDFHSLGETEEIPYNFQGGAHNPAAEEEYTLLISDVFFQETTKCIGRKIVRRLINSCRCSCKDNFTPVKK